MYLSLESTLYYQIIEVAGLALQAIETLAIRTLMNLIVRFLCDHSLTGSNTLILMSSRTMNVLLKRRRRTVNPP